MGSRLASKPARPNFGDGAALTGPRVPASAAEKEVQSLRYECDLLARESARKTIALEDRIRSLEREAAEAARRADVSFLPLHVRGVGG